jgi:hypothetical protein
VRKVSNKGRPITIMGTNRAIAATVFNVPIIVIAPRINPRNILPVSPIKIFAG